MFRGNTPLDHATEKQVEKVIECAIRVHRELGPGFFELAYQNAMCVEKRVVVRYAVCQSWHSDSISSSAARSFSSLRLSRHWNRFITYS